MGGGDQSTLADDGSSTAYTARIQSPNHLRLGDTATELHEKSFPGVFSIVRPTGNYSANITATIDGRVQSNTISLVAGSSDLIGSTFIIGTSLIGSESGTTIVPTPIGDRGRAIQLAWSQGGVDQDFELYGYALAYAPGESLSFEVT